MLPWPRQFERAWMIKQLLRALANLAQHLTPQARELVAQLTVEVEKELADVELLDATAVPFQVGRDLLGKSRTWIYEALSDGKLDVVRKHKQSLITIASIERRLPRIAHGGVDLTRKVPAPRQQSLRSAPDAAQAARRKRSIGRRGAAARRRSRATMISRMPSPSHEPRRKS